MPKLQNRLTKGKKISLFGMSAVYLVAGCNHFINPEFYIKIMPAWLPAHVFLIYLSGFFEILFALLLIPKSLRRYGTIGIILLLITVFPANVNMALNYIQHQHPYTWLALLRLPFQFVLIYWAWSFLRKEKL